VWHGRIKPVKPLDKVTGLNFSVNTFIVESGEHKKIIVLPTINATGGERGHMDKNPGGEGQLRDKSNEYPEHPPEPRGFSKDGKHPDPNPKVYMQRASAHEAGHAWGLDHPNCDSDVERANKRDPGRDRCYAQNAEQASSVMGFGEEMKVTKGAIDHSDFGPFIAIGQKWAADVPLRGVADQSGNKWVPA
jgi:hypothetical protein